MDLQEYFISKIDNFGGIKHFIDQIEHSRIYFPEDKQFHIDELKIYMAMVYQMPMNINSDSIKYRDKIISCTEIYRTAYKETGNMFCHLMITLNEAGINETITVRNIV